LSPHELSVNQSSLDYAVLNFASLLPKGNQPENDCDMLYCLGACYFIGSQGSVHWCCQCRHWAVSIVVWWSRLLFVKWNTKDLYQHDSCVHLWRRTYCSLSTDCKATKFSHFLKMLIFLFYYKNVVVYQFRRTVWFQWWRQADAKSRKWLFVLK